MKLIFIINKHIVTLVLASTLFLHASLAHATPKPLPFSYFADVKQDGDFELETVTDLSPVRVARTTDDGTDAVTGLRLDLTTELELGIGHGLELGWYFTFAQDAAPGAPLTFDGVKQRLRWALADPNEWPIDVGLYFELAEKRDEIEIEQKILLSKRVGAWRFLVNLWVEQEYYLQADKWELVYHPTAGLTYDISPNVTIGLEYWAEGELELEEEGGEEEAAAPAQYLGPTIMLSSVNPWLSIGVYLRLDTLGEAAAVGDAFGQLWFRTIVAFDI